MDLRLSECVVYGNQDGSAAIRGKIGNSPGIVAVEEVEALAHFLLMVAAKAKGEKADG